MTAPLLATPGLAERAAPFVDAAVLSLGDLHVVDRLGRRADVDDVEVLLGLAFVVRAPRFGHTGVDPTTLRAGIVVDEALALAWPDDGWHSRAPMASLVGGDDAGFKIKGDLSALPKTKEDYVAWGRAAAEGTSDGSRGARFGGGKGVEPFVKPLNEDEAKKDAKEE